MGTATFPFTVTALGSDEPVGKFYAADVVPGAGTLER